MRKQICIRVSEALKVLPSKKSKFYKELINHIKENGEKGKGDWIIEGDEPNEDGSPRLYIIEDSKENRKILLQHQQVDLSDI